MNRYALILDDEAGIRKLVGHILAEHGYVTRAYESPVDALGCKHSSRPPDLIISDMQMPHRTGLDYVRDLFQSGKNAKHVALMSGSWNNTDLKEADALGCKVFFKPDLTGSLRDWLQSISG